MTCQAHDRLATSRQSVSALLLTTLALVSLAGMAQAPQVAPAMEAASATIEVGASVPAAVGAATPLPSSAPVASAPRPKPSPPTGVVPDWQGLSPAQQQLLAPLEREWNGLDATRKGKWLELAARYPGLPADEQARVQHRLSSWAKLSPAERQQARLGFQVAQQLKADERQAKWEAYQALPVERRQELADKAAQKTQPASGREAKAGKVSTVNLVALVPKIQPELPLGPTVLQAKPGASTILITQGKPRSPSPGAGRAKLAFNADRLDSKTLLPKPAARRASDSL